MYYCTRKRLGITINADMKVSKQYGIAASNLVIYFLKKTFQHLIKWDAVVTWFSAGCSVEGTGVRITCCCCLNLVHGVIYHITSFFFFQNSCNKCLNSLFDFIMLSYLSAYINYRGQSIPLWHQWICSYCALCLSCGPRTKLPNIETRQELFLV